MRILPVQQKITAELRKADNARKAEKAPPRMAPAKADHSDISANAQQRLSDTKANAEIVAAQLKAQPEIRQEKIEEVRKKIDSGFYNSAEFVDKLADKLISDFGLAGQGE